MSKRSEGNRARSRRRLRKFAEPAAPEGSLRSYFVKVFASRLKSRSTRYGHESAVHALARFLRYEPMLEDLMPSDIEAFRQWGDDYYTEGTIDNYCSNLRRMLRQAIPDRFPHTSRLSRRPKPQFPSPGGGLLEFFESTYAPIKMPAASPHSIKNHRIAIGRLERHLGRPPEVSDLNDDTIAGLAHAMGQGQERGLRTGSTVTLNTNLKKLRAQWRFAARRGLVRDWPEGVDVREPKRIPRCWSLEQFATLLEACQEVDGEICDVQAGAWWRSLHLFIFATGARFSAAMAVRWQDLNLETGVVTLLAEHQKQFADQQFKLPAYVLESLGAIRWPKRELVWPWSSSRHAVWYHYAKLLRSAGLPANDRKLKFHALRKLSASLIKKAGGNPTEHLGHSSPHVTAVYLVPEIVGVVSQCHLLPDPVANDGAT